MLQLVFQDVVYVDSTTTGINIVLKSLKLAPDDIIVATNHTYGATRKAATEATNRYLTWHMYLICTGQSE